MLRIISQSCFELAPDREGSEVSYQLEHAQDCIDVPPLVGCESFCSEADLGGQAKLELRVCHLQESEQLPRENTDVLFVDERVRQF